MNAIGIGSRLRCEMACVLLRSVRAGIDVVVVVFVLDVALKTSANERTHTIVSASEISIGGWPSRRLPASVWAGQMNL